MLSAYHKVLFLSAIAFVAGSLSIYLPIPWSEGILRIRSYDAYGSLVGPAYGVVWLVFLLLGLVARIGMYFLDRWARGLFVGLLASSVVLALIHGVAVLTPLESAIGIIGLVADGALLVFAFTDPLRGAFRTTAV